MQGGTAYPNEDPAILKEWHKRAGTREDVSGEDCKVILYNNPF